MTEKLTAKQKAWEEHIKAREEQNLSFVEYASKYHLNLNNFYAASSAYNQRQKPRPEGAFQKVVVKKAAAESAAFSCKLNNVDLQFDSVPNSKWFAQVLDHMGASPNAS